MNWCLTLTSSFLLFLVGCASKIEHKGSGLPTKDCRSTASIKNELLSCIQEQEAKLADVPIPLDVTPIPFYCTDSVIGDDISFGYTSNMSGDDLLLFYSQEMERLGWKKRSSINSIESFLYYEKPGRFCVISVRPQTEISQKTRMIIIIFAGRR